MVEGARERGLEIVRETMEVYGAPLGLSVEHRAEWLDRKVRTHDPMFELLKHHKLPTQVATLLLRVCGLPRVNFLTRALPVNVTELAMRRFDESVMSVLHTKLSLPQNLPDAARKQLTWPIRLGGRGLRSFERVRWAAHWGALALAASDLQRIVPEDPIARLASPTMQTIIQLHQTLRTQGAVVRDKEFINDPMDFFTAYSNQPPLKLQRLITRDVEDKEFGSTVDRSEVVDKARLKSVSRKYAGAWIMAVPTYGDLSMTDVDYIIQSKIHLGVAPIANMPTHCSCGVNLTEHILHFLHCKLTSGRAVRIRHDRLNRLLARIARGLCIHTHEEPYDIQRRSGLRPDIRFCLSTGYLAIDTAITSPVARSNRSMAARIQLSAARKMERRKISKYSAMAMAEGVRFLPWVMECFGAMTNESLSVVKEIAKEGINNGFSVSVPGIMATVSIQLGKGNALIVRQWAVLAREHARRRVQCVVRV